VLIIVGAWSGFLQPAIWLVALGASATAVQRVLVARREISRLPQPQPQPEPTGEGVPGGDSGSAAPPLEEVG